MSTGFSLFLIAVGAILYWAVTATVSGIDINTIGAILMVVGIIGLALSLLFWSSFAPFADSAPFGRRRSGQDTVVLHDNAQRPQTVVMRESAPRETVVVREPAARPDTVVIHENAPRSAEEIRREDLPR